MSGQWVRRFYVNTEKQKEFRRYHCWTEEDSILEAWAKIKLDVNTVGQKEIGC